MPRQFPKAARKQNTKLNLARLAKRKIVLPKNVYDLKITGIQLDPNEMTGNVFIELQVENSKGEPVALDRLWIDGPKAYTSEFAARNVDLLRQLGETCSALDDEGQLDLPALVGKTFSAELVAVRNFDDWPCNAIRGVGQARGDQAQEPAPAPAPAKTDETPNTNPFS
ncbi:hypothetical protein [Ruegeria sp. HKCCA5426]|uniref:hypothetical protein n=1 Tax=Ruegeria sp. HKCCA5426 TaxID=2682985 RepID=UPI001489FE66|nr:hypothetical protein [Ruegeria sp. HKCCA5426]